MNFLHDIKPKSIPKGTMLFRSGEVCKTGYFVLKGCLKSYVVDNTGKEHIIQFAPEDWIISDLDSFTNQKPSVVFIEAIEDSEVVFASTRLYDISIESDNKMMVEVLTKLRNNLIATNKRLIALLSATAEERYLDFLETYPSLFQRLPLKLIASYLGMTPEYLSDVRKKLTQK